MNLTSKYDLGQRVYGLSMSTETIGTPCEVCKGTGELALVNGGSVPCTNAYRSPRCYRGKVRTEFVCRWYVKGVLTVGRVTAQATEARGNPSGDDNGVCYMCRETGIGSGQIHSERDLFATIEEAQAKCAVRNVGCDKSPTEDTITMAYDEDQAWEEARAELSE